MVPLFPWILLSAVGLLPAPPARCLHQPLLTVRRPCRPATPIVIRHAHAPTAAKPTEEQNGPIPRAPLPRFLPRPKITIPESDYTPPAT